ncbi:MAG: DUF4837 family protein [Bacteroidales bacterium]|nr:MAG: DUF4837 family protein [Bacteroidales bacterium]
MKQQKSILQLISFLIMITLFSCKPDEKTLLPKISGAAGEVLLIIETRMWDGPVGEKLNEILTQPILTLPQPEPVFKLMHTSPAGFTNIFKVHRNIIFARIGSEFQEPRITIQRNQWATPQLIINIQAPNEAECISLIEEGGGQIIDRINKAERERLMEYYRSYQVADLHNKIKDKHHLSIAIPKGYEISADDSDFVWLSTESAQPGEAGYAYYSQQSILIYYYDYRDTNTFTTDFLVDKRNEYTGKYISGSNPGSYMATENLLPPVMKEFEIDGRYFAELRGLWKMENGAMGGPFVNLSTVDEERNRVITVDGFVFAAGLEKREFLRQVESILFTLKID